MVRFRVVLRRRVVLLAATVFLLRAGLRRTVRLRVVARRLVARRFVVLRRVVRRAGAFFLRRLLNATSFAVARRWAAVLRFFCAMRRFPFFGLTRKITQIPPTVLAPCSP